jgi:hypothetical protein
MVQATAFPGLDFCKCKLPTPARPTPRLKRRFDRTTTRPHPPGGVVVLTRMDALLSDLPIAKYLHSLGLLVNICI